MHKLIVFISLIFLSASSFGAEWYEGGTLSDKDALVWQEASQANKIATSAHFVAVMATDDRLKSKMSIKITSAEELKIYATQLSTCIDGATEKNPDEKENKATFSNQSVSALGGICATLMGWL